MQKSSFFYHVNSLVIGYHKDSINYERLLEHYKPPPAGHRGKCSSTHCYNKGMNCVPSAGSRHKTFRYHWIVWRVLIFFFCILDMLYQISRSSSNREDVVISNNRAITELHWISLLIHP